LSFLFFTTTPMHSFHHSFIWFNTLLEAVLL
jgi:hypothetical protein